MFRKHNQKQKTLPVTPRLRRTFSIHHLECSDYVLPVEMASDTATSKVDFRSQKSESSESHEHDELLLASKKHQVRGTIKHVNHVGDTEHTHSTEKQANLVEKLHKKQDAFSKQMESFEELGRDVFQSNDLISTKEFIDEHGESFLEIVEEPDILLEIFLQDLHRCRSERASMMSSSSPMVGLSAKRHNKSPNDRLVNQEVKALVVQKSEPAVVDKYNAYYNSEFSPRSFLKHTKQGDHGTLLSHSRTVKKKLKDVSNENRKEHLHISMDGLLHKIPYGHTASGNVMKEKLFRSASARHFKESIEDNPSFPRKAQPHQSFRRSRSLTESSYKYCHVFESILTSESKRLQENLTSTDMDFGLQDQTAQKVFEKIHSNPEFDSFRCEEVPNEPLHGALLSEAATSNPLNGDEAIDIHTPAEPESEYSLVNVKESIEPGVFLEQTLDVHPSGKIYGGLELPLIISKLTETKTCRVSCTSKENIVCIPLPNELSVDQQESLIELHQNEEVHEVSGSSQMGDSHVAHEHALEVDSNDQSTKPSPTSVFQLNSEDDRLRPAKHEYSEDSETEPRNLHFEEVDLLAKTHNLSVFEVTGVKDTAESNFGKKQQEAFANVGKFHNQVDQKDEADFNYVRDALRKSGFNGLEFVGAQHFPKRLVGQLLSDGHEVASYDSDDLSPEHQLLFDLIDEILLEISEKYSIGNWLSRFDPDTRTMPGERNILDEVWRKISSHLSSQTQPRHMDERVVARDYAKNDGWLNLRQDAVCLGVELEDLLLDGLLDELILDCDDISGYYSVFS
ncbi:hypothetical protein B296_00038981 [Ensete ventricosum]|uniref:DUF4378 domain-containing protein n=1 Tax=Ensete ventricosum TaxID=4639 RepID=A0A426YJH2_ENSVE|nr:hypothetical protein B296_00038981 [Ensete ventricosum]